MFSNYQDKIKQMQTMAIEADKELHDLHEDGYRRRLKQS